MVNDTTSIPISFTTSQSYNSAEFQIGGYQDGLTFMELDTAGTLIGSAGWSYAVNEVGDSLVISALAGSQPISGSGVLCNLKFVASGAACQTYPVNLLSALFDTGNDTVTLTSGSVTIIPEPSYGDVDVNGQVQAYDAAMILKHLVGLDTLSCQGLANAEVSLNDTITALDASLILQYRVDSIDTLPYAGNLLVASGDFGVLDEIVAEPGQSVTIPINLNNGSEIYSVEGSVLFDNNQLTYESMSLVGLSNNAIQTKLTGNQVFFAYASAEPLDVNGELGNLRFMTSNNFQGTSLTIESLRINENLNFGNITAEVVLGVGDETVIPTVFALHQNYPNPFNPTTTLQIDLPQESPVQVMILDMLGRTVTTLVDRELGAGVYRMVWNGKNNQGQSAPTGLYFARMKTPQYSQTIKMLMMK
ncbi:MAG: T9SS type A sorting domain-containing protein [FCB group bacterium]|nr:T9SS type A sorting domain-containing protein [FCB group bacterium]